MGPSNLFYNHIHINQTQHDRCYCYNCQNNSIMLIKDYNNYISIRGGVRSDIWDHRTVLAFSFVLVTIHEICIWCFINDLFVACVDGMYGQNCAVNVHIQIRCWSYEHSVLSIDRTTLFRIHIDEIIIQIVSYIINCIIITVLFASSIFCNIYLYT
jgi:hypothetical protein